MNRVSQEEYDDLVKRGRIKPLQGAVRVESKTATVACVGAVPPPTPQQRVRRKAPKSRRHDEDDLQISFVAWCVVMERTWPELALLFHPANGGTRVFREDKKGRRYSPEAQRLKKMGVKAGVPDIMAPISRGGYNGFAIEFKSDNGVMRDSQTSYCRLLRKANWLVLDNCKDIDTACLFVTKYFKMLDCR